MNHDDQPRRVFLQQALATVGVSLSVASVASILLSCETDEKTPVDPVVPTGIQLRIADYPKLTGPGTITQEKVTGINGGAEIFISQIDATTFAVFSSVCTHQGCIVSLPPEPGANCLCFCHFSEFNPTTGVVKPGSLAQFNLKSFASTYNASTGVLSVTP